MDVFQIHSLTQKTSNWYILNYLDLFAASLNRFQMKHAFSVNWRKLRNDDVSLEWICIKYIPLHRKRQIRAF